MKLMFFILFLLPSITYAETILITCNYLTFSNEEGSHKIKDNFILNFVIDNKSGKSHLIGNNGSSEVSFFKNDGSYTFAEMTETGNFSVTTVDKNLKSVHSRNMVLLGELIPSQYYGSCQGGILPLVISNNDLSHKNNGLFETKQGVKSHF